MHAGTVTPGLLSGGVRIICRYFFQPRKEYLRPPGNKGPCRHVSPGRMQFDIKRGNVPFSWLMNFCDLKIWYCMDQHNWRNNASAIFIDDFKFTICRGMQPVKRCVIKEEKVDFDRCEYLRPFYLSVRDQYEYICRIPEGINGYKKSSKCRQQVIFHSTLGECLAILRSKAKSKLCSALLEYKTCVNVGIGKICNRADSKFVSVAVDMATYAPLEYYCDTGPDKDVNEYGDGTHFKKPNLDNQPHTPLYQTGGANSVPRDTTLPNYITVTEAKSQTSVKSFTELSFIEITQAASEYHTRATSFTADGRLTRATSLIANGYQTRATRFTADGYRTRATSLIANGYRTRATSLTASEYHTTSLNTDGYHTRASSPTSDINSSQPSLEEREQMFRAVIMLNTSALKKCPSTIIYILALVTWTSSRQS
ncbi:hypothetical protein ScPMuIL_016003 [Solemya velum]